MGIRIEPTEDRILVEPIEGKDVTDGGLHIPATAKELPCRGKVLGVGPGKLSTAGELLPMFVAAGDVVVYSRYGGEKIDHKGETLLILRQSDAMAILRETTAEE